MANDLRLGDPERQKACDITLAVEFLLTAQRAILRGFSVGDKEVAEPLKWANIKMGTAS